MASQPTFSASTAAPAMASAPYLSGLNPEQLAAVTAEDGPLLVLAGAGTGKTRVLTTRLAHILLTGRARPHEVLAVTFTNRAAREMVERLEGLVGRSSAGMWLGTFHAMGVRMLRAHAELVGLQSSFTILDSDDQERLAKQIIQAADLDERRWPARLLVTIIQRWKDRGYRPDQVPASETGDFALGKGVALYAAYQQRLVTLNACDFGDLLLHGLTLLTQQPGLLAQYQRRFRTILVDEYQDTNVAQYLWLRLLAGGHKNVTCVGDDDQSIYSWRGADAGDVLVAAGQEAQPWILTTLVSWSIVHQDGAEAALVLGQEPGLYVAGSGRAAAGRPKSQALAVTDGWWAAWRATPLPSAK